MTPTPAGRVRVRGEVDQVGMTSRFGPTVMLCFGPTLGLVACLWVTARDQRWGSGGGGCLLGGAGRAEAVGVGAGLDDVGVEGEPVHDGGGEAGVGEGGAPFAEGGVGGAGDGGLLLAFGDAAIPCNRRDVRLVGCSPVVALGRRPQPGSRPAAGRPQGLALTAVRTAPCWPVGGSAWLTRPPRAGVGPVRRRPGSACRARSAGAGGCSRRSSRPPPGGPGRGCRTGGWHAARTAAWSAMTR